MSSSNRLTRSGRRSVAHLALSNCYPLSSFPHCNLLTCVPSGAGNNQPPAKEARDWMEVEIGGEVMQVAEGRWG
jgi:hypothetical protein